MSSTRWGTGTGGRLLTLALLLLALWGPSLPGPDAPLDLVVLWDDSASMDQAWLKQSWSQLKRLVGALPPGSRFSLVRFAAEARLELPWQPAAWPLPAGVPRHQPLDPTQTVPAAAMHTAAGLIGNTKSLTPGRAIRLLLLSDGRRTQGPDTLYPATDSRPLLWWRPPPGPALWVNGLWTPASPKAKQQVPVNVDLGGQAKDGDRLELRLDGRPVGHPSTLSDGSPSSLQLQFPAPSLPGVYRLTAVLSRGADELHHYDTLLRITGPARVLYIGQQDTDSAIVFSLRRGGWPVRALAPDQADPEMLETADTVILDDVAVHRLSATFWHALAHGVRSRGLGLLVLGGTDSFAAGGYRHSLLESLLPVTTEAPHPLPSAALLFLVDSSGSMGRRLRREAPSRLAMAKQAVLDTASNLEPGDLTGLLVFGVKPHELLPLARRRRPERALEQAWALAPHGGTRLAPALAQGIERLRALDIPQRLLVLVTDGFVEESMELERLAAKAAAAPIRIIALAIGSEARLKPLRALADATGGRVLKVAEVAQLPRLMRTEVERERKPVQPGPVTPRAQQNWDLLTPRPRQWPPLSAYMLVKPRPGARVLLTAANADPLLVEWVTGSGRVVVLPGGLGAWAQAWYSWQRWGELLGGLVEWTAALSTDQLFLTRLPTRHGLDLQVDVLDEAGDWPTAELLQALASDPLGRELPVTVETLAPGRYQLHIAAHLEGVYSISLRFGDQLLNHSVYFRPTQELDPGARPAPTLVEGLTDGRVHAWTPTQGLSPEPGRISTRGLFISLALLVFLFTLVKERGLLTQLSPRLPRLSSLYKLRRRIP